MKIIGHHTCSPQGDIAAIEVSGPFRSTHEDDLEKAKFLGTGYYFWDNHINMAHTFGQKNYNRHYFIFEAELNIEQSRFLDLAGDRIAMINFKDMMDSLKRKLGAKVQNWTISQYIEFLKLAGDFPYDAIRAIDTGLKHKPPIQYRFVTNRDNTTSFDPIFIICLLKCDKTTITSFKHKSTFPNGKTGAKQNVTTPRRVF